MSTNKRLLIIDDEENLAKSLSVSFKVRGYDVSSAITSADGLRLVKEFNPDILLLDLHLSEGKTGLDVLREAKVIKPALKVVVLTGFGDEEGVEDECFRLGAIKFLPKAFTISELIEEIGSV
jgi:ActR/RegA family two-component response regulator